MSAPDLPLLWQALPSPALAVDANAVVVETNQAAEAFFGTSKRHLVDLPLEKPAGADSRLMSLVRAVLRQGVSMAEYDVELGWPETPPRHVDLSAAPVGDPMQGVLILFHPRAIAETMDRSLTHRNAARSVTGMAAMLAHEVKNPLAGISGAAQLLDMNAAGSDRELTQLIREETDRIGKLLSRVEAFGAIEISRREPVNIHDVIDRAARSAKAGFASHLRFLEEYDPSLPATMGDADQLVQVFLNLLKNAADATPEVGGIISLRTRYRAGMKVITPSGKRESLPLQILVSDNGSGVPEELQRHIFEPFVTSKSTGSGLGLALVSKIVADHGGVISCESEPGWTRFRMLLPVATAAELAEHPEEGAAA
ncbi:MAG: ATP-binding protein [Pseudomonadota bacterium]